MFKPPYKFFRNVIFLRYNLPFIGPFSFKIIDIVRQ